MEPWFRFSWLGIWPTHPNGWAALGAFLLFIIAMTVGAFGGLGEYPLLQAVCVIGFVAGAVAFFWFVFWNFDRRSD